MRPSFTAQTASTKADVILDTHSQLRHLHRALVHRLPGDRGQTRVHRVPDMQRTHLCSFLSPQCRCEQNEAYRAKCLPWFLAMRLAASRLTGVEENKRCNIQTMAPALRRELH